MLATVVLLLAFSIPAILFNNQDVAGGLIVNEKVRSGLTRISQRSGIPDWYILLCSLNCLQKSIAFTPFCPRAGPTGGVGAAPPAGIVNFNNDGRLLVADKVPPLFDIVNFKAIKANESHYGL